jgi:hypothetical protein
MRNVLCNISSLKLTVVINTGGWLTQALWNTGGRKYTRQKNYYFTKAKRCATGYRYCIKPLPVSEHFKLAIKIKISDR